MVRSAQACARLTIGPHHQPSRRRYTRLLSVAPYSTPRPNLFDFGKPFGGRRPASARLPRHSASSLIEALNSRPAEFFQVRPSLSINVAMSASAAFAVFLQAHAAAARHLLHLSSGKISSLRLSPITATLSPATGRASRAPHRHLEVQHLLALAGLADESSSFTMKPCPSWIATSSLRPRLWTNSATIVGVLLDVDQHPHRLAMAAPARQLVHVERVELAVGREQQQLVGGLRLDRLSEPSSVLNVSPERSASWPFSARIQPLSDNTTVTGSFSTIASSIAARSCSGSVGELGAALAERRLWPELSRLSGSRSPTLAHCSSSEPSSSFRPFRSARSFVCSVRISISSSLRKERSRMLRIASACTSVSLKRLHQHGLRLVLGADDLDHLVEVEIGDQIAFQHFQPLLDLLQAVLGAAPQHDAPMVEPLPQAPRRAPSPAAPAALQQHVHVERDAAFQLGQPEQLLHQQLRIDIAATSARARCGCPRRIRRAHRRAAAASCPPAARRSSRSAATSAPAIGNFGDDDLIRCRARLLPCVHCARGRNEPRPVL